MDIDNNNNKIIKKEKEIEVEGSKKEKIII